MKLAPIVLLAPFGVVAAQADQPDTSAEEGIVVTGSRIRRRDLAASAPVTVISREQIIASGKVSIGDFLQSLPQQGNAINTQVNSGGDGSTRIALRGLGSTRTLVLINGRRFVPGGTGADASVDLNSIPTAAIERVEILEGGASALYGSDAVAGVVNLITRKNVRGAELSAFGGISPRGDGNIYDLNVTAGQAGDQGNVVFNAGYYKQEAVWAGDRDFSRYSLIFDPGATDCMRNAAGACAAAPGEILLGSDTVPAGRILVPSPERGKPNGNTAWNTLVTKFPNAGSFMPCVAGDSNAQCLDLATAGRWRPYTGAGLPVLTGDRYNFQPQSYDVTPAQLISLYSAGDLRLGASARGYYEASFVNRQSEQKRAAEPLLTDGEGVTVSKDNLYNPFGRDFTAVRRRLLEFGPRVSEQDVSTFRAVGGVDGKLPGEFGRARGWLWDVSFNFGRTEEAGTRRGNRRVTKLQDAVGPSMIIGGRPACVKTAGDASTAIPGCVPLDLFHGAVQNSSGGLAAGSITPDQVEALGFIGVDRGINQMTAVQANASGELFSLGANRAVGLAVGYEYRLVYGAFIPDPISVAGESTGNFSHVTRGGYHVNEGYAELSIPILRNVTLADSLELALAGRVFDYSTFGSDATYKVGAIWRPVRDVTIRGTYSTSFRAPSISELYGGEQDNFPAVSDPCARNVTPGTALAAACGQAVNNGDDQTMLHSRVGANPHLSAETARTLTFGVVLEPALVKNLAVAIDYYSFAIDQAISTIGEAAILSACYPSQAGVAPRYCNLIQRDPSTHYITLISNLNANVGAFDTDGIDLAVRYSLPTHFGRFGFIFDGTWLHKFDVTLGDRSVIKGRGVYDLGSGTNGGVYPAFKANGGITFGWAGLNLGVGERFIGSYWECAGSSGWMDGSGRCNAGQGGHADLARKVAPYFQTDVYASYGLNSGYGKTMVAVGINNALDVEPPRVYNALTPVSDPTAYDFMGRYVWGRLTHTF